MITFYKYFIITVSRMWPWQLGHPKKWQVLIFAYPKQNYEKTYVEGPTDKIL